jgi:hypothetical protein
MKGIPEAGKADAPKASKATMQRISIFKFISYQ